MLVFDLHIKDNTYLPKNKKEPEKNRLSKIFS